jgi:hypothetical protein
MSDESFDPWKSLASELGVDPNAAPPPPPAPTPPSVAPTLFTPLTTPEPKKVPSDWSALANDLGIEVPPEPEKPIERKDPVAELLGWPAQSRAPEPKKPEARDADDFEEREPWDVEDVRGRWGDEADKPPIEGEPQQTESRSVRRDDRERDRDDGPRRGRRRGGRGRGRSGDRGQRTENLGRPPRDRDDRRPRDEGYRSDEPPREEDHEIADDETPVGELGEAVNREERQPSGEEEPDRRPRRRRGRRRSRGERSERGPTGDQPKRRETTISGHYDEPDSVAFGEDLEDIDEVERIDNVAGEDFAESSDMSDSEDDGPRNGKSSVRDIMTWKEAIGIIIETNMQERARNPRSGGHGGHGGHGGRGRRGGRRGG